MAPGVAAQWANGDAAVVFHLALGGLVVSMFLALLVINFRARRKKRRDLSGGDAPRWPG